MPRKIVGAAAARISSNGIWSPVRPSTTGVSQAMSIIGRSLPRSTVRAQARRACGSSARPDNPTLPRDDKHPLGGAQGTRPMQRAPAPRRPGPRAVLRRSCRGRAGRTGAVLVQLDLHVDRLDQAEGLEGREHRRADLQPVVDHPQQARDVLQIGAVAAGRQEQPARPRPPARAREDGRDRRGSSLRDSPPPDRRRAIENGPRCWIGGHVAGVPAALFEEQVLVPVQAQQGDRLERRRRRPCGRRSDIRCRIPSNSVGKISTWLMASPNSGPWPVATRRSPWSTLLSSTLLVMSAFRPPGEEPRGSMSGYSRGESGRCEQRPFPDLGRARRPDHGFRPPRTCSALRAGSGGPVPARTTARFRRERRCAGSRSAG